MPVEAREGVSSPGTEVIGGCELSKVELGTKLRSHARAVSALITEPSLPSQKVHF